MAFASIFEKVDGSTKTLFTCPSGTKNYIVFSTIVTNVSPAPAYFQLWVERAGKIEPDDLVDGREIPHANFAPSYREPWHFPHRIVLSAGDILKARTFVPATGNWDEMSDWDTNPNWDDPGRSYENAARVNVSFSVYF